MPRTFTVTVTNTCEKLENIVKLLTNIEEVDYWRTYGRMEASISFEGKEVKYLSDKNIVPSSILKNEIIVNGSEAVAVPFMIRSYKHTGFVKERIQIRATYREAKIIVKGSIQDLIITDVDDRDVHDKIHRFTVTERF